MSESDSNDWGVREIATALGMPASSAHRAVTLLEQQGILSSDPKTRRYGFGHDFFRIASQVAARLPIREVAMPHIRDLAKAANETAALGIYDPTRLEFMLVAGVEADHSLRLLMKVFEWVPLYAAAGGRCILAFVTDEQRRQALQTHPLAPFTPKTITRVDELEKELVRIRERRYALSIGERIPGSVGIAAPIFGPPHSVVGNVILNLPEARFNPADEKVLAGLVMHCAGQISTDLGAA
jgi:DNA-binding IclR family transcriptional regulator